MKEDNQKLRCPRNQVIKMFQKEGVMNCFSCSWKVKVRTENYLWDLATLRSLMTLRSAVSLAWWGQTLIGASSKERREKEGETKIDKFSRKFATKGVKKWGRNWKRMRGLKEVFCFFFFRWESWQQARIPIGRSSRYGGIHVGEKWDTCKRTVWVRQKKMGPMRKWRT